MPGEGDLIAIRMKLLGGKEAAAEADAVSASIAETGAASESASAKSVEASKASETAVKKETIARQNATRVAKKQAATSMAIGKGMTKWITGGVLAIGAASVYLNAKVERNLLTLHTQAGVAKKELKGLRVEFQAISKETGFSTENIIGAGYRLAGAGLRGKKLKEATRSSALLAMVGDADPEDTAKTLSQIWFTNIKGGKDFNKVIGEINATVGAGDLRLPQLVDALGTGVVASAKQAGLTLQDVNGAMAVFGDETNNVSGWSAQLATALHFITNPTEKAEGALGELGLSSTKLSEDLHKPHGLATALGDLKSKLAALPGGEEGIAANRAIGDILPGGRGRVLLVLINQLERLEQKEKQIRGTREEFGQSVKETQEQPLIKLKKAWQQVENAMLELGAALTPIVIPALAHLGTIAGNVAGFFDGLSPSMKGVVGEAVALAAAIGPLILLGGKLSKAWAGVRALTAVSTVASGSTAAAGTSTLGARFGLGGLLAGGGLIASNAGGDAVGGKLGQWIKDVGGGASVGAGIGMAAGGPFGALIGGGLGAGAGAAINIVRNLTGAEKVLSVQHMRLARDGKLVAQGMQEQRRAGRTLVGTEDRVQTAQAHSRTSTRHLAKARRDLATAVHRYGAESAPAVRAEHRLAEAIEGHRRAAKRLRNAERLRGVELSEYKTIARENILNERNEINTLQSKAKRLNTEYVALKKGGAAQSEVREKAKAAAGTNERLHKAQTKMNETLLESAHVAGPAFSKFLKHASRELVEAGSQMGALTAKVEAFGEVATTASEAGMELGPLGETLAKEPGSHKPIGKHHGHALDTGKNGPVQSRHAGPVDRWSNSPDSHPTEYTAPTSSSRGGRGTKTLQPIVLQVGRRQLANITAEIEQDDEARL